MTQQQPQTLSPEQIQAGAQAGMKLLSDDERVNVPPSMAISGSYQVLMTLLGALASGQAVMSNPPPAGAQGATLDVNADEEKKED